LVKLYKDDCTPMDTSTVVIDESIFGWEVYIATFVVWVVCYFCMWKGVNSSSYVVWVTVPLPLFFIVIMVINNLMLEGAGDGVAMYLKGYDINGVAPDYAEKLGQGQMWSEACGQIFFSLGICMGSMTSYASYNKVDKPIIRDSFIIAMANCTVSFIAGFAVFSVVGYLNAIDSPVSGSTASIGLAFIAYPAAIETLPWKNLWAIILSITLFTLGIDSAFSMLEAASTVIQDHPSFKETPRKLIALFLVVLGAFLSVFFCFNWGFTLFDVIDHYLNVYLMLLLGVMECFGAGWIYELIDVRATGPNARTSTTILLAGYWGLTLIVPPLSIFLLEDLAALGIAIFYGLMIPVWIASLMTYGGGFGQWYSNVFLYGVRKLSRSMTKLSKEEGQTERGWWEPVFELWWGFSIKYIVPFALSMLLWLSMAADFASPYGSYHWVWQAIGISIPALGFIGFIVPVFFPPGPEPFDHDVDAAFKEDDFSGTSKAASLSAAEKSEMEMVGKTADGTVEAGKVVV
jgi:SNF family Na+-dependent transporter